MATAAAPTIQPWRDPVGQPTLTLHASPFTSPRCHLRDWEIKRSWVRIQPRSTCDFSRNLSDSYESIFFLSDYNCIRLQRLVLLVKRIDLFNKDSKITIPTYLYYSVSISLLQTKSNACTKSETPCESLTLPVKSVLCCHRLFIVISTQDIENIVSTMEEINPRGKKRTQSKKGAEMFLSL